MSNARNLARLLPNSSGQLPDANLAAIAAGKVSGQLADANMSSGSVLQVVQGLYKGATTVNSNSYVSIPVSATITPVSSTSKILVSAVVHCGMTGGNEGMHGRLYRNGNNIAGAVGDASGSRDQAWFHCGAHYSGYEQYAVSATYLDSPESASALTYQLYVRGIGGYPFNINTTEADADNEWTSRTVSSITLMEIAA